MWAGFDDVLEEHFDGRGKSFKSFLNFLLVKAWKRCRTHEASNWLSLA